MSTPFHLTNKTILVTGASSGIGRQVAISCSQMGAKLVITGRDKARLEDTFKALEGKGHIQQVCDLMDEKQRTAFVESLPNIDGVVHCVGVVMAAPAKFTEEKHLRHVMSTNFEVAVLTIGRLLRAKKLNKNSSLVFFSSIGAHYPYNGGSLYNASKAAIEAYSRNIALEHFNTGIRSNCLVPAMVNTPMYDETIKGMYRGADEYAAKYPLGIGKPEDIANAAIYLLSDASRWVTGINLTLDGGYTLTIL
jgi:NAD(P)-dependent dehydrogenase (short-subunit alcohol dehydrogenase family)